MYLLERLLQFVDQIFPGSSVYRGADQAKERSGAVTERFHRKVKVMPHPLDGDSNFRAASIPCLQDILLDGRQPGPFFGADDIGIGLADEVLAFPSQEGRTDPGVPQLPVLSANDDRCVLQGNAEALFA